MKKLLALLLSGLMLLSVVSCANSGEDTDASENASDAVTEGETADMSYTDELPALSFNDEIIHVLGSGQVGAQDELFSEGLNNELINDTVYERNRTVEQRLGVKLDVLADGGNDSFYVSNKISNLVTTGTDEYQLVTVPSYVAVKQIVKGEYLDLDDVEHIDLDKHYWSQGYNRMASWGDGHQFMASGSAALTLFRYMYVTLYNKDILKERQLEDPFAAVQNGDWTLDCQTALTEGIYEDVNGNGKIDSKDLYGFVSGSLTSSDCHWIACRATVLTKDEDGYIIYDPDVERITAAVDKVLALYYRQCCYINTTDSTYDNSIIDMFAEGRAFMANAMITKLEVSMREFSGDYGILPIAKLDKAQPEYLTCVQDQVSAFMLPCTVPAEKQEMMGALMECIASESYKTVVDAYYNTALSYRYLNNPESKIMLDLIYDSVSLEIAQIYTEAAGNFLSTMRAMVGGRRNSAASSFKKQSRSMDKAVEKLNSAYEKIVK